MPKDLSRERQRAEIRAAKRRQRAALSPAEQAEKSASIVQRLLTLQDLQRASNIFLYRAVPGEVSLAGLKEAARGPKHWLYPLCFGEGRMEALLPDDENAWKEGSFGILEPLLERSRQWEPEAIDLVLVPLVAFDRALNRIGMGGGYYDRYLLRCPQALHIGVAFEIQYCPDIPIEPWDQKLDLIVTERSIYR